MLIDSLILINIIVPAGYFEQNGKSLLHVSGDVLPGSVEPTYHHFVMYFHSFNPWLWRFNWYFQASYETGLKDAWDRRAT